MVTASAATAPAGPGALPWLAQPLARTLRSQRGHALLVHGAEGAGQFEFAIALARAWLCETPPAERPQGLACGHCESCHLVAAEQVHPDLCVLLPETAHLALGWRQKADQPESAESKKKPSEWISIKQVRAAIEFSTLTRGRARLKVVVIHPAERMPQAAASALLKLLEEPHSGQRFVLASGDPAALMPTVRSRCHAVALPLPDPLQAAQWLTDSGLADAQLLLKACGGQPLAALQRNSLGLDGALWSRLPAWVAAGDGQALGRLPVALVIESLQKLCHDAMLAACGAPVRYFPTDSVPATADLRRLSEWGRALSLVARHADHPWNAGLMLESLVLQGQRALATAASRLPADSSTTAATNSRVGSLHSAR